MFRRDLELAGHMVLREFAQKRGGLVQQQIIIADARANKDLLYARQRAQFPQDAHKLRMIRADVLARLRK